jgi:hypothetical protein
MMLLRCHIHPLVLSMCLGLLLQVSRARWALSSSMTSTGLHMQAGQQKNVQVRVVAEFVAGGRPLIGGNWAKQPCNVCVWPGETLLLWEQPSHRLGRKFGGDAAIFAYPALYGTFMEERVAGVIGG